MAEKKTLNPAAMTVEEVAKTLGIPRKWLEADIAAGAPTNDDGTVNLVHYGRGSTRVASRASKRIASPKGKSRRDTTPRLIGA